MKLAESLQERADLNRKIEQLRMRIQNNVLVQEGEKPAEDPDKLMKELEEMTELIAKKDVLRVKQSAYRDILYAASQSTQRARNTEIKIVPVLKAAQLQKKADELAKEIRLLDNKIQQANWTADLME